MPKTAPANAYPRGLHAVYRGRTVREPRAFERPGKPPMVTCRIAVKMAAPSAPRDDHNALTEWVNVIAFTERTRHLLMQCEKGMLVAISGNVTKEFYKNRSGDRDISRTIIVEDILSTGGSLQPDVAHPADMDLEIKTRLTDLLPESEPLPDDGLPDLD